jgi:predicted Mrr-cat superfamily restriction endonuclease
MAREVLTETVAAAYPDTPNATKSLFVNMLWAFFHEISPGDIVIARRGRKTLAAAFFAANGAITQ